MDGFYFVPFKRSSKIYMKQKEALHNIKVLKKFPLHKFYKKDLRKNYFHTFKVMTEALKHAQYIRKLKG